MQIQYEYKQKTAKQGSTSWHYEKPSILRQGYKIFARETHNLTSKTLKTNQ